MLFMCVKLFMFFRECLFIVFTKEKIVYAVQIYMYSVKKCCQSGQHYNDGTTPDVEILDKHNSCCKQLCSLPVSQTRHI